MYETRPSLILRVKNPNDAESWREFVELYQPLLVRYARRHGLTEHDALDVAQDIVIKLLRLMPSFQLDPTKRFRGWLSRMVYNAAVTWHRQRQVRNRIHDVIREDEIKRQLLDPDEPPAEWRREHRHRVLSFALAQVRQRTRSAQKWACFEQHVLLKRPAAKVAEELGITANYVFVNASRVLRDVREQCAEYEEELSDD